MKIHVGDVIGLEGEISGHEVMGLEGFGDLDVLLLDDGREVRKNQVFVVRTDNEDGTATETFSDGRVRVIGEEEL